MSPYTLIIAEKPDAAVKIAGALDDKGRSFDKKSQYFDITRNGERIIVVPASGHLYSIAQIRGGRNFYPVFNYQWFPKHRVEKRAQKTAQIIETIKQLSGDANNLINATDFDIEGSLIGYNILKYACSSQEIHAKRMKFSTLTDEELVRSFNNLLPSLDFDLAEAGRTRHEVDWLYGINLSRALTLSVVKRGKGYTTLSVGRVQGPTLKLVVEREAEIQTFMPSPFWQINATVEIAGKEYSAYFELDRLHSKNAADEVVKKCSGKLGSIASIDEKELRSFPPEPFDLGSLQREAYRFFGYTPRRTLDIAERLYLDAAISYPRTSSQKLPPTIGYYSVLQGLSRIPRFERLAHILLDGRVLKPKEGKKDDPAHPAIYPTGKIPSERLADGAKLYHLIAKRFMAAFGSPFVKIATKISISCEGYKFTILGKRVKDAGWAIFYQPYAEVEEFVLPKVSMGQRVLFKKVESLTKFTEPPPRYNPASLLREMEDLNIGTKATRADIIDTLYKRGYILQERITPTNLGFGVAETLSKYCPEVCSVELTRHLEEKMALIERREETRNSILEEYCENLLKILSHFQGKEVEVGERLSYAIQIEKHRERTVGVCPACKTGFLIITRSRISGKQFIGCTNFFKNACTQAFPLPQTATVHATGKLCNVCGYPTLLLRWRNKRPFRSCINMNCPTRAISRRASVSKKVNN